jgi:hypothetical protein
LRERHDLFVRDAEFAADGSVDVLSKLAAVDRGYAPVDERLKFAFNKAGGFNARPHPTHAAKDRGPTGVQQVIQEWRAPLFSLRFKDSPRIIIHLFRVYFFDSCHRFIPLLLICSIRSPHPVRESFLRLC